MKSALQVLGFIALLSGLAQLALSQERSQTTRKAPQVKGEALVQTQADGEIDEAPPS
jgi:hypothetical protein